MTLIDLGNFDASTDTEKDYYKLGVDPLDSDTKKKVLFF